MMHHSSVSAQAEPGESRPEKRGSGRGCRGVERAPGGAAPSSRAGVSAACGVSSNENSSWMSL